MLSPKLIVSCAHFVYACLKQGNDHLTISMVGGFVDSLITELQETVVVRELIALWSSTGLPMLEIKRKTVKLTWARQRLTWSRQRLTWSRQRLNRSQMDLPLSGRVC